MDERGRAVVVVFTLVLGSILAVMTFTAKEVQASPWTIQTVDAPWDVGLDPSIVIDDKGFPHIAYRTAGGAPKHAWWNGTSWRTEVVDRSGFTGWCPSIAMDSLDRPHMSYFDYRYDRLRYASWNGSAWMNETVDSSAEVGRYTSLAIDRNDRPRISYYDQTNSDLKYASWNGTAWEVGAVDTAGSVGTYTSMALDGNDRPHISYIGNGGLKHAWWNGSVWKIETVELGVNLGWETSLALDSMGTPHIAYYDQGTGNIRYAAWNGTVWHIETVDRPGTGGAYLGLDLDGSDYPHIAYNNFTSDYLSYAKWTGNEWSIEGVEWFDGYSLGMVIDEDGASHIAYYESSNADLKYATGKGNSPPPTPSIPTGPTSGVVGTSYTFTTSSADPDGDRISYTFDWGDGTTSQAAGISSGIPASQAHAWLRIGTYSVRAMAVDEHGYSSVWNESLGVTIRAPPRPPRNLTATATRDRINLTWEAPLSDGGSPLLDYLVYRGTAPTQLAFLDRPGVVLNYSDMSALCCVNYYYSIRAENIIGIGSPSNVAVAMIATTPSAPLNLSFAAGDRIVTLVWDAPESDGGSAIINYTVYRGTDSGLETLVATSDVRSFTDTGLENGRTYYYRVGAVNAVGEGPKSEEVAAEPQQVSGGSVFEEPWFWMVVVCIIIALAACGLLIVRRRKRGRGRIGSDR